MRATGKYLTGATAFFCALLVLPPTVTARTITVDDDAPADFTTIQAAIDDANDGDKVMISPGTYTGPGNRDIDFKAKAIIVRSTDPNDPNIVEATVIDCNEQGRGFHLNGCSGATIAGLTITNGLAANGGGIYVQDSNAAIANCRIAYNRTHNGESPDWEPAGDGGHGGGIYCTNSHISIFDSTIGNNAAGDGGSSNTRGGEGGYGGGIYADQTSLLEMYNCTMANNITGDGGDGWDSNSGTRGGHGGGIYSISDSPVVLDGCTITGNSTGQGGTGCAGQCSGSSGHGAGIYCRSAILKNSTVSGNTTGERNPVWLDEGSRGSGGGVYCEQSLAVFGSLITNNEGGGGIYCSSLTMSRSKVGGNKIERGRGGGIYCDDAEITCSTIANNSTERGTDNWPAHGGGVCCSTLSMTDCVISDNSTGDGFSEYGAPGGDGGGVYSDSAVMSNCLIASNTTGNGGWGMEDAKPGGNGAGVFCNSGMISNCTIVANVTGEGPAPGEGEAGKGGGICCGSNTTIVDSIIWGNSPDGLFGHDCNNVTFSDIQDSNCLASNGNISADPCLVDPGYWDPNGTPDDANDDFWIMGDYHLSQTAAGQPADSPCVDAGSDTAANLGMAIYTTRTDKLWDQGIVDMGYHYAHTVADLNDDGTVDMKDLTILALQWNRAPALPSADIVPLSSGDGTVNIHDLALLADWWLWPW